MAHGSMVEVIWTEPTLQDLDAAIADYIASDNPEAGRHWFFLQISKWPTRQAGYKQRTVPMSRCHSLATDRREIVPTVRVRK
jgi:hypothetical protein